MERYKQKLEAIQFDSVAKSLSLRNTQYLDQLNYELNI
jgi:hypothetical protein